jgi:hypothetical protein
MTAQNRTNESSNSALKCAVSADDNSNINTITFHSCMVYIYLERFNSKHDSSVSVKSLYLAEKLVFLSKHCRGGICYITPRNGNKLDYVF